MLFVATLLNKYNSLQNNFMYSASLPKNQSLYQTIRRVRQKYGHSFPSIDKIFFDINKITK